MSNPFPTPEDSTQGIGDSSFIPAAHYEPIPDRPTEYIPPVNHGQQFAPFPPPVNHGQQFAPFPPPPGNPGQQFAPFPPQVNHEQQFAPFPPPPGQQFPPPPSAPRAPIGSAVFGSAKKVSRALNLTTVVYVAGAIAAVSTVFALVFGDARMTSVAVIAGIIAAAAWGKDTADKQSAREEYERGISASYAPQPQTTQFPHPQPQPREESKAENDTEL